MSEICIPDEWIFCAVGELGEIVTGKTPSTKDKANFGGEIPFLKPGDLDAGGNIASTQDTLSEKGLALVPSLPKHSIAVTCIGNLGKVGITTRESASNQQINSILPSPHVSHKFLYHYMTSMKWWLEQEASATTVAIINKGKFSKAPVKLPPLAEQKEIAARLDDLLAQVASIKTRLDGLPAILKRFRQSTLAAAVSGKLTEEWRGTPAIETNQSPVTIGQENNQTPKGWDWKKLLDLADLESGHTPRKSVSEYWEGGDVYWICLQDIRAAHGTTIVDTKHKPTMLGIENSSARLLPKGTVCFSRDISVGFTTIMGHEMSTTQHFANWICGEELFNEYLMLALMAAKDHLTISGQGTTVKTIYMPALKEFRLLTPPEKEQTEIVRRVEELFAFADQVEQRVKDAQAHVNHLTQSILAKAFRGELTADWRAAHTDLITGENSAAALLERIKSERAKLNPKKRTLKSKY